MHEELGHNSAELIRQYKKEIKKIVARICK